MAAWIGPAIVAAFISSLVTALGWFVASREEMRRDERRRRERILDLQSALLAEIRANHQQLKQLSEDDYATRVIGRIEEGSLGGRPYTPFFPRQVPSFVFETLLKDIYLLPSDVIDPVVVYYRQISATSYLAEDLRSERFGALDTERKLDLCRDYLAMLRYAGTLAQDAIAALRSSLGVEYTNRSASAPSDRKSA